MLFPESECLHAVVLWMFPSRVVHEQPMGGESLMAESTPVGKVHVFVATCTRTRNASRSMSGLWMTPQCLESRAGFGENPV